MEPCKIPFLNGCFPLDSCGADSDRGAIAGNHCRHHSRHQGCTMLYPPVFFVYIHIFKLSSFNKYNIFYLLRKDNLNWNVVFYFQGGRLNTSWLKKPCFRELCIAYGRSIYLLKIEKDSPWLEICFCILKIFHIEFWFCILKCQLAKGLLARIPTGFTVTLLLQLWNWNAWLILRVLDARDLLVLLTTPMAMLLVFSVLLIKNMVTTLFSTIQA